jgi:hypothetical protein
MVLAKEADLEADLRLELLLPVPLVVFSLVGVARLEAELEDEAVLFSLRIFWKCCLCMYSQ